MLFELVFEFGSLMFEYLYVYLTCVFILTFYVRSDYALQRSLVQLNSVLLVGTI